LDFLRLDAKIGYGNAMPAGSKPTSLRNAHTAHSEWLHYNYVP